MPKLSQLMIRAALLWQGLGATIGALILAAKAGAGPEWAWALREAHIHMLLAGWLVQLAAGVAYWILPRHDAAGDRGDPRPMAAACAAINLAVLAVLAAGSAGALGVAAPAWAEPLAGALEALAFALIAHHAWGRALPFRELPRRTQ